MRKLQVLMGEPNSSPYIHKNSRNYNSLNATTLYAFWRFYPILIRVFVWYIQKYFINIVVTFRVKLQWSYRTKFITGMLTLKN